MWSTTSKIVQRQIQRIPQTKPFINYKLNQQFIINQNLIKNYQRLHFVQVRSFSSYDSRDKRNQQNIGSKDEYKQLPENKTFLQKILGFFKYTFRYGLLSPLQQRVLRFFGINKEPKQQQPWYSSFWNYFSGKKSEQKRWYQRFNVFRNVKDKVIHRTLTFLGIFIFIYILAKAIPRSFRSYKLRQQEIDLENKRLEVEKLRLELELKQKNKKQ